MPDINLSAGSVGTTTVTLTASAVQIVNFAEDIQSVEVYSDGIAPVWWTCDGTTPAVGVGYYIPAVVGVDSRQPRVSGTTSVRLFSTGTPTVRVQRGD